MRLTWSIAVGDDLVLLYDEMRITFKKAGQEIGYGKDPTVIKACTVKVDQLDARLTNVFEVNSSL